MIFTVVWMPTAISQLANYWMNSSNQNAVSESSNRIDQQLRIDAHLKGTRFGPFRAFFDDPLSVLYTVDEDDRMVRVYQVRHNK